MSGCDADNTKEPTKCETRMPSQPKPWAMKIRSRHSDWQPVGEVAGVIVRELDHARLVPPAAGEEPAIGLREEKAEALEAARRS
jgi:hypothetical protein